MGLDYGKIWNEQRKITRGNPNPLDVSTIVSIFPQDVHEYKPTCFPGEFWIPKGTYEKPSVTHIGQSYWVAGGVGDMPEIEVPQSSIVMADSIIKDFANSLFGITVGVKVPGLFYVLGKQEVKDIKKELLDTAKRKQDEWFHELVRVADILWVRTNGNPTAVSELNILAGKTLGMEKPWMSKVLHQEMTKCVACQTLINASVIVCPNCKVIVDKKRFDEMKLAFAG